MRTYSASSTSRSRLNGASLAGSAAIEERADPGRDPGDLGFADPREDRQRGELLGERFRHGKRAAAVAKLLSGTGEMCRLRIVQPDAHAVRTEMIGECIPPARPDVIEMPHRVAVCGDRR